MAGHAFISYSHRDSHYVERLVRELTLRGLDVWTDRGVEPGERWLEAIEREIRACAAFVPVISEHSCDAQWVQSEILRAQDLKKPILPLLLSGRRHLALLGIQDEDVTDGAMPSPSWIARLERVLNFGSGGPDGEAPLHERFILEPENARLERTLTCHTGRVRSLAFSQDARWLASGSEDRLATVWDVPAGKRPRQLEYHSDWVCAVAWSPDGRLATAGGDRKVVIWEGSSIVATLGGHTGNVLALAWSPDAQLIASASADCTVRVGRPTAQSSPRQLLGHTKPVFSVSWGRNGQLATGSADRTARAWNPLSERELRTYVHPDAVRAVSWSPDCTRLATACSDGLTRVWNVETGAVVELAGHTGPVWAVAWSPGGIMLASAGEDTTVRLWCPETETEIKRLAGHQGTVRAVAWLSVGGHLLASGGEHGAVFVWTLKPPHSGA